MRRVGFYFKVKKDLIPEYVERHKAVWPEMLQALRDCGWHNYSIFLREDGLLFGYLETEDFEGAQAAMASRDVNLRWQKEMAPFFEIEAGRRPDESMILLREVFHLD